jgi:dipeptide/tripeptide permease
MVLPEAARGFHLTAKTLYPVPMPAYRSAPRASRHLPPGIPYIIANEGAERFSFYGMRAIRVVFMTQYLLDASGALDLMSDEQAKGWYHLFVSAVYFTPLLGALLSDGLPGKYRTIITLSLVYCLGHLLLALDHTRIGLFITVLAFAIPAWIQQHIDQGGAPSIAWQLLAYLVLTSAEVTVSITCLEFSYTQAPKTMKSFVMALIMCRLRRVTCSPVW